MDIFLQFMSVSRDGGGVKGCDLLHSSNVRVHDSMFGRIHQVHPRPCVSSNAPIFLYAPPVFWRMMNCARLFLCCGRPSCAVSEAQSAS